MWRWAPRRSGPVQVPVVLREPVAERALEPAAALESVKQRTAVRNIVARPPEAQNIAVLLPEVQHTAACRSWLRLQPI